MARSRLERILDAALDLATDYFVDQIKAAQKHRLDLAKPPKKGEVIIDADYEIVSLPSQSRRRRRTKALPSGPTDKDGPKTS